MPIGTSYSNVPDMTMRLREYQQAARQPNTQATAQNAQANAGANARVQQQETQAGAGAQSVIRNPEIDETQSLQMQQLAQERAMSPRETTSANEQIRMNDVDAAMGSRIDVFA